MKATAPQVIKPNPLSLAERKLRALCAAAERGLQDRLTGAPKASLVAILAEHVPELRHVAIAPNWLHDAYSQGYRLGGER